MAAHRKRRRSNSRTNKPIAMAMVLLYLTIFSVYLTSGLYAKYTTQDNAGDGARVIKFGGLTLTETCGYENNAEPSEQDLVIIPGVNLIKDVEVSFTGSEADTYIFVEAEMKGWVTNDHVNFSVMSEAVENENGEIVKSSEAYMSVSVNGEWKFLTSDKDKYVYYLLLESNTEMPENAEKFIAKDGLITVSPKITRTEIKDMTDIEINITAYAAQAGGFLSPQAAWESVSN